MSDDEASRRVYLPIDAAMRAAFRSNAPAALARRSNGYLFGMAMMVGQWLVIGTVSLLGLYQWQWQPLQMLAVFVVGIAAATLGDLLRWLFARRRLLADYRKMQDDSSVWDVVTALQQRQDRVEKKSLPRPGAAILLDVVLGGFAIWLLFGMLPRMQIEPAQLLAGASGVRAALVAVCVAPLLSLLSSLFAARKQNQAHDDLEFRAGGRGIGLLLMTGALWFLGGRGEATRSLMIFINAATVVVGVISVLGVWLMYREREWLRREIAFWSSEKTGVVAKRKAD